MKFTKRLLLLLLCFAVLSSAFSLVASADSYNIQLYGVLNVDSSVLKDGYVYPSDPIRQTFSHNSRFVGVGGSISYYGIYISNRGNTPLAYADDYFFGKLENIYINGSYTIDSDVYSLSYDNSIYAHLVYVDGSTETISSNNIQIYHDSDSYYSIYYKATAKKDVSKIFFQLSTCSYSFLDGEIISFNASFGEPSLSDSTNQNVTYNYFELDIHEKTGNILERVFSKIGDIHNSITSLPSTLWAYISDSLTGFFVPDENTLSDIKSDIDSLVTSKFGAVYQVITLLHDIAQDIQYYDDVDSIIVPEVTIEFSGVPFTFGGWDIRLIPYGFGALVDVLKTIIGVVCTFAFFGGLRKRYDEVFR